MGLEIVSVGVLDVPWQHDDSNFQVETTNFHHLGPSPAVTEMSHFLYSGPHRRAQPRCRVSWSMSRPPRSLMMGRESLRSVRGEKHIFKMLKDLSPQGVNAECGVNRAAGAGGQIGHFSLDFAVMMNLCCGPARATAASPSESPLSLPDSTCGVVHLI